MTDRTSAVRKFPEHQNDEAKRTSEKASAAGEQATRRMEDAYSRATQGTVALQQKILATTHANMDAAFECARELLGVTSPSAFMEVYTKHARQQLQTMTQQTRELADLAQKTAIESMGPLGAGLGNALVGRPDLS